MGRWKVDFRFTEMLGNIGFRSGCIGPFPYTYSFLYEIYQKEGSTRYVLCRVGDDCVGALRWNTLQQATELALRDQCQWKEHGMVEWGTTRFVSQNYASRAGVDLEHTELFEELYGKPKDLQFQDIHPITWSTFRVPPSETGLVPWGRLCDQYDWPDQADLGSGFGDPLYAGALRHENVTWVWIKDLTTCPCFPECQECHDRIPGASYHFKQLNADCLAQFGVTEDQCEYKIVGVGGGPMLWPPATTGRELNDQDEIETCWVYSQITGEKQLGPDEIAVPDGIELID